VENINIEMTRLGGGYGRRSYAHWLIEAAVISQKVNAPIKLIYSREDDMTGGIYRPMYQATYRAALDKDNQLIGFHVNAGGLVEPPFMPIVSPLEPWKITCGRLDGPFQYHGRLFPCSPIQFHRSGRTVFLDEVAEAAGKDPIDFRLELLQKAKANPIGQNNDYDADRFIGVLELLKVKSNWGQGQPGFPEGYPLISATTATPHRSWISKSKTGKYSSKR
jgi:isoquinoline 1-oxidoreductase subunit beta